MAELVKQHPAEVDIMHATDGVGGQTGTLLPGAIVPESNLGKIAPEQLLPEAISTKFLPDAIAPGSNLEAILLPGA